MKHIRNNDLIIEHITKSNFHEEYIVGEYAHVTLVLLAQVTGAMSIVPSVRLRGTGASADIYGVLVGHGSGSVHISTLQHHEAPNTTSNLLIKSVMSDGSSCSYDGSIVVDRRAQKTDAYQRNENLLLGDQSTAVSSPALEIQANDVRCTHGAVVKTLDNEELWYMATRGIRESNARHIIAQGFLTSTFTSITDEPLRLMLELEAAKLPV